MSIQGGVQMHFAYNPENNFYTFYHNFNTFKETKIKIPLGTFLIDFLSLDLNAIEEELNSSICQSNYNFDLSLYHSTEITNILKKYCNEFLAELICNNICFPNRIIFERTQQMRECYLNYIDDLKYYLLNGKFKYDSLFNEFELNNFQKITVQFGMNDDLTELIILYSVKELYSMLSLDLVNITHKHICIKQCKNCRQFFIPSKRTDEIYCDRIFKNGKTCKELGYTLAASEDPFKVAFTKARKTQHARIRYNNHIKDYKEKHYEPWLAAASKARDYFSQKGDINSFFKWLEEHKNSF